jgi:hypothetical protein
LKDTSLHVHGIKPKYRTLKADADGILRIGAGESINVCTYIPETTEYGKLT